MVNFNPDFHDHDNLPAGLREKIEAALEQSKATDSFDALKDILNHTMESHNSTPDPEIGGFSPAMLYALGGSKWDSPDCPLKLSDTLIYDQLQKTTGFCRTRTFLIAVRDSGGIKATTKGNLPRSFVNEMVDVFLDEEEKAFTLRVNKVLNEQDVFPLHVARIHCKLTGLIGLTKGKFTLRKKAHKLLEPEAAGLLYKTLFTSYFQKYNIGYAYNHVIELDWLQREAGYVLMPLQLQADKWINAAAIAPKLLHPMIHNRLEDELKAVAYMEVIDALESYFFNPLETWGLLEIERTKQGYFEVIQRIRKTELFDQFIRFEA
jgi:hypothetical protein